MLFVDDGMLSRTHVTWKRCTVGNRVTMRPNVNKTGLCWDRKNNRFHYDYVYLYSGMMHRGKKYYSVPIHHSCTLI